jgi:hypothetical protein
MPFRRVADQRLDEKGRFYVRFLLSFVTGVVGDFFVSAFFFRAFRTVHLFAAELAVYA